MVVTCHYCKKEFKTTIWKPKDRTRYCNHQCEKAQYFLDNPSPHRDKRWLEDRYIKDRLSFDKIAILAGVGHTIIAKWCKKFGIKSRPQPMKGKMWSTDNVNWKGGVSRLKTGYVLIYAPEYPGNKKSGKYAYEHHLVVWKATGENMDGKSVHHKNGVRDDNRIENLQVFDSNSAHIRYEDKINSFCKKLLWGDILGKSSELKEQLLKLFEEFLKDNNKT